MHSKKANYQYKHYPAFEDFGDATLIGDNGATGYFRVDWFTPDGRTENAMTQEHAFKAAELSIIAQRNATHIE